MPGTQRSPLQVGKVGMVGTVGMVGAVLTIVASLLTGCTSDKDSADTAAEELASSLAGGTLPDSLFVDGSPQAAYDEIVEGLGSDRGPEVALLDVTEGETGDGDSAEATLEWRWELGTTEWEYETTAPLTDTESGWQAGWSPELVEPSLGEGETLGTRTVPSDRADILGARGKVLVTDRPVVRLGIDKTKVRAAGAPQSARALAEVLAISPGPLVKAVRAAGDEAFVEALVLRPEDAGAVVGGLGSVPGAVALDDTMPLAPTREFAAPVLGRVGQVTAELVEQSDGRLAAGDVAGLSGLQLRYDEQLAGTKGLEVVAVAEDGSTRTLHSEEPVDGEPLRTTLDLRLQGAAERVLADVPDVPSALVAIRPSTGAVVAAASGPGAAGINVATYGQYAPGSTFKVVTTLALLRSGLRLDGPLECPASLVVDGKRFENYDDYPTSMLGRITLREAVAHSCNTAFIGSRSRLDPGTLAAAAESLGLGTDHDLGFPSYFGQVPSPESETEAAAALIGQGKVLASPLVMASVAASVQSGGTVVPHLLTEQVPSAEPAVPLSPAEAEQLREAMRAVVAEGSGALLDPLPGEVGAKTGTAEHGEPGADGDLSTHAWMIAFSGDLAVAVFVDEGESGSRTAGPLLEAFLRAADG
jgi:cell division protein FtsI/penicillin-binding protein 2